MAIDIWNEEYKAYKERRWPGRHVEGIPEYLLFTLGCKGYKPVIPVKKRTMDNIFGYFRAGWFLGTWYEVHIQQGHYMDTDYKRVGRTFFLEVVLHEFGHVLALEHLKYDALMYPTVKKCNALSDICLPVESTFDNFVKMYDYTVYSKEKTAAINRRIQENQNWINSKRL